MKKTILVTGSTDGIGLMAAKTLAAKGHHIVLHGRNESKLAKVVSELNSTMGAGNVESYLADMSDLAEVASFAESFIESHNAIDVLINNAGVFKPTSQQQLQVWMYVSS